MNGRKKDEKREDIDVLNSLHLLPKATKLLKCMICSIGPNLV